MESTKENPGNIDVAPAYSSIFQLVFLVQDVVEWSGCDLHATVPKNSPGCGLHATVPKTSPARFPIDLNKHRRCLIDEWQVRRSTWLGNSKVCKMRLI